MTARLALEPARDERSVTVAAAAERLGCDQTTVRELLRKGLLAGQRIGKTDRPNGVRVKMWSIEEWERRHAIGGDDASAEAAPRQARATEGAAACVDSGERESEEAVSYPHPPPPRPNEQSLCSQVKALLLAGIAPEEVRDALRAVATSAGPGGRPSSAVPAAIGIDHFDSHVRAAGMARFAASLMNLGHELKALQGHLANGLAFAIRQRNDEAAAHLADVVRNGT